MRKEKRVTPLQKVMNFMKEREYRTSELFRMLDRDVTMKLTVDELAARLKVCYINPNHLLYNNSVNFIIMRTVTF